VYLDAVDFSVIQAHDMLYTARIAAELGRPEAARRWEERSRAMSRRVHDLLWDEAEGFYFDRDMDGRFERVRGVTGFLPLMLDDMSADRAGRLVRTLRDPKRFAVPFPLPTVALDEPSWSRDMWRGCAWANTNYLVIHGLRRRGYRDEAAWIARSTVEHVDRYYQRYGVLFEFFDSRDEVAPPACDRKGPCDGPYDIRRKVSCIRDYHWTAAVTACLLTEGT
jgi:neutral trehalase